MSKLKGEELRAEVRKIYNHSLADVIAAIADRATKDDIQAAFMDVTIELAKERRERGTRG